MTDRPSRVVLITGASSGIGRATAELLAARGHRVFGGVRAPATTRPLAGVLLMPLDVRNEVSVKACVDGVMSRAGRRKVVAEEVLRATQRPYRMRWPIGQAALLSRLSRLLPARLFEPSLRKAFALDPSSRGTAVP